MSDRSEARRGRRTTLTGQTHPGGIPPGEQAICRPFWRSIATIVILWLALSIESSAETPRPIGPLITDRFIHTGWTADQGAPQAARSIAQTNDGYLWFANQAGLTRFDGVRFELYEPPRFPALPYSDISALMASPDGGLWIGYRTGGATFLKGDRVTNYSEREGLPSAQVQYFAIDADGTPWIATSGGLLQFQQTHWNPIGVTWGLPSPFPYSLFADDDGGLWAIRNDGIYRLPPHSHRFFQASQVPANDSMLQTADGTLWSSPVSSKELANRVTIPEAGEQPAEPSRTAQKQRSRGCHANGELCAPSSGGIWIAASHEGIGWLPDAELIEKRALDPEAGGIPTFTQKDGLTDDYGFAILEDREGNIWVTTKSGVDRFRPRSVYPSPSGSGLARADLSLIADRDGAVWAGADNQPLMRIQNDSVSKFGPPRHVVCMFRDRKGAIWIGGWGTLTRFAKNRFQEVKVPPGLSAPHTWKVRSITQDQGGALWVSIVQSGVFRLQNGQWEQYGNIPGLPRLTAIILWGGSDGRTWFGYTDNRMAALDGDKVTTFSAADGLAIGNVTAIEGRRGHVWAGGQFGLARLVGSHFVMMTSGTESTLKSISGIVEMENGDLWLNQQSGIAHVTAAELEARLRDPHHPLKFELFESRDGVRGTATQMNFLPTAIAGTDGRIWVSGTGGASWIDPAHLSKNTLPPPVFIQAVFADGRSYPNAASLEIPPSPSDLQIDYTALSLSIPERVHFRYQLQGVDKDWQDVGTRRSAFYTRLKPRRYQFKVIACNNDGVWNEQGAALTFVVLPAFYQTWWFTLVYLAFGACVIWLFYLYRLKLATAQIRERLRAQLEERERIARELHDTLLQGFQGLMLRFHAVMKMLPAGGPAEETMRKVLDRADEVLLAGRESIRHLREQDGSGGDLPEVLARYGEELAQNHTTLFSLTVVGRPEPLRPVVFTETYRVAREAVLNVFEHAKATKVEVEITYSDSNLNLRVRDDGVGIDARILSNGRAGHWGLSGMRERGHNMSAQFNIWSQIGAGTEVELVIPASVAYLKKRESKRWHRFARTITAKEEARS